MTIATGHAARVHLTLQERTPDVDFVALLAVGMVERAREQRRTVIIEKRFAGRITIGDLAAPRMALRARFDLSFGCARPRAHRISSCFIRIPTDATPLIKLDGQSIPVLASIGLFPL